MGCVRGLEPLTTRATIWRFPHVVQSVEPFMIVFKPPESLMLCCVQMMVRFFIENCPEEKTPTGKKAHWVFTQHKESPRKRSVFKGLWLITLIVLPMRPQFQSYILQPVVSPGGVAGGCIIRAGGCIDLSVSKGTHHGW